MNFVSKYEFEKQTTVERDVRKKKRRSFRKIGSTSICAYNARDLKISKYKNVI